MNGSPLSPKFSPDGTRIRFNVLDRNSSSVSLWEAAASGSAAHPLFPSWHQATAEYCGAWTAEEKYFFFLGFRGSPKIWALPERPDLLHKRTSQPLQVTNGPLSYYSPVLSRHGGKLFVVGERAELLRYDDHSGQFTLFLSGISAGQLDFSREAQFIAYVAFPDLRGHRQHSFPEGFRHFRRWRSRSTDITR